jgi:hypothetical protein
MPRTYNASPAVLRARGKRNALTRHRGPEDPATLEAERDLRAVTLEEHIRRVVDEAPPLTPEQLSKLSALLAPRIGAGRSAGDGGEAA